MVQALPNTITLTLTLTLTLDGVVQALISYLAGRMDRFMQVADAMG